MRNGTAQLVYREQKSLWRHMATQCAVPLVSRDQYRDRVANLKAIIARVNDGGYSPAKPHGFLSAPKQYSVARFVPVFNHADTAVYFACLQYVDHKLAAAAVPQTFGGWSIGGARRDLEEGDALRIFGGEDSLSIPASCYNRAAWVNNWSQFWKLLAAQHEHAEESAWFALFDIANFYDSVDLHRLENGVRSESAGGQFAMNVLFHLLRTWNKGICLYSQSTKGLPMDIVGDCSRLLANFYLTGFDASFRNEIVPKGGDYMRFADDMVVRGTSEKACHDFVFRASEKLHELVAAPRPGFLSRTPHHCPPMSQRFWISDRRGSPRDRATGIAQAPQPLFSAPPSPCRLPNGTRIGGAGQETGSLLTAPSRIRRKVPRTYKPTRALVKRLTECHSACRRWQHLHPDAKLSQEDRSVPSLIFRKTTHEVPASIFEAIRIP